VLTRLGFIQKLISAGTVFFFSRLMIVIRKWLTNPALKTNGFNQNVNTLYLSSAFAV
jgi:hypothetical protein